VATETFTRLIDDLDGGKAERTISFSLDGRDFAIDLSKKNITALEKALAPYISAARRGERPARKGRGAKRSTAGRSRPASGQIGVREWARANGYEVSDRGRISADVQSAFDAAK
jgi:hypothetical protein